MASPRTPVLAVGRPSDSPARTKRWIGAGTWPAPPSCPCNTSPQTYRTRHPPQEGGPSRTPTASTAPQRCGGRTSCTLSMLPPPPPPTTPPPFSPPSPPSPLFPPPPTPPPPSAVLPSP